MTSRGVFGKTPLDPMRGTDMRIRNYIQWRTVIVPLLALSLLATACSGGGDEPTITVGSFNFPESVILAEIYAQAMEDAGYPVETELNLGARELIFTDLQEGNIDFLPEYVGSSLGVGFGGEPTSDTEETRAALQEEFDEFGFEVLEPAPGQDKNVFVVTQSFADEHDLETVSDLANVDDTIVFGGPPECQERETCLLGLQDTYGLDNIEFQAIQEGSVRISSLENGDIDLSLLFSTQPVINERGFVALEDDQGMIPAENIVPVVNEEILDAYGDDLRSLINSISAEITTDTLLELNGQVELEGMDPAEVATQWLQDNGFVEG
ncbi:MAG: ABC transporter substrate-binding protein [Halobacteriales archaeon]|nr:ABC transporter substrate-binding protein [Halobacteriales archaeon]